eukprot:UC4_evm4s1326
MGPKLGDAIAAGSAFLVLLVAILVLFMFHKQFRLAYFRLDLLYPVLYGWTRFFFEDNQSLNAAAHSSQYHVEDCNKKIEDDKIVNSQKKDIAPSQDLPVVLGPPVLGLHIFQYTVITIVAMLPLLLIPVSLGARNAESWRQEDCDEYELCWRFTAGLALIGTAIYLFLWAAGNTIRLPFRKSLSTSAMVLLIASAVLIVSYFIVYLASETPFSFVGTRFKFRRELQNSCNEISFDNTKDTQENNDKLLQLLVAFNFVSHDVNDWSFVRRRAQLLYLLSVLALVANVLVIWVLSNSTKSDYSQGLGFVVLGPALALDLFLFFMHKFMLLGKASEKIDMKCALVIGARFSLCSFGPNYWFLGHCLLFIGAAAILSQQSAELLFPSPKSRTFRHSKLLSDLHKSTSAVVSEIQRKLDGEDNGGKGTSPKEAGVEAEANNTVSSNSKSKWKGRPEPALLLLYIVFGADVAFIGAKPETVNLPFLYGRPQVLYGILAYLLALLIYSLFVAINICARAKEGLSNSKTQLVSIFVVYSIFIGTSGLISHLSHVLTPLFVAIFYPPILYCCTVGYNKWVLQDYRLKNQVNHYIKDSERGDIESNESSVKENVDYGTDKELITPSVATNNSASTQKEPYLTVDGATTGDTNTDESKEIKSSIGHGKNIENHNNTVSESVKRESPRFLHRIKMQIKIADIEKRISATAQALPVLGWWTIALVFTVTLSIVITATTHKSIISGWHGWTIGIWTVILFLLFISNRLWTNTMEMTSFLLCTSIGAVLITIVWIVLMFSLVLRGWNGISGPLAVLFLGFMIPTSVLLWTTCQQWKDEEYKLKDESGLKRGIILCLSISASLILTLAITVTVVINSMIGGLVLLLLGLVALFLYVFIRYRLDNNHLGKWEKKILRVTVLFFGAIAVITGFTSNAFWGWSAAMFLFSLCLLFKATKQEIQRYQGLLVEPRFVSSFIYPCYVRNENNNLEFVSGVPSTIVFLLLSFIWGLIASMCMDNTYIGLWTAGASAIALVWYTHYVFKENRTQLFAVRNEITNSMIYSAMNEAWTKCLGEVGSAKLTNDNDSQDTTDHINNALSIFIQEVENLNKRVEAYDLKLEEKLKDLGNTFHPLPFVSIYLNLKDGFFNEICGCKKNEDSQDQYSIEKKNALVGIYSYSHDDIMKHLDDLHDFRGKVLDFHALVFLSIVSQGAQEYLNREGELIEFLTEYCDVSHEISLEELSKWPISSREGIEKNFRRARELKLEHNKILEKRHQEEVAATNRRREEFRKLQAEEENRKKEAEKAMKMAEEKRRIEESMRRDEEEKAKKELKEREELLERQKIKEEKERRKREEAKARELALQRAQDEAEKKRLLEEQKKIREKEEAEARKQEEKEIERKLQLKKRLEVEKLKKKAVAAEKAEADEKAEEQHERDVDSKSKNINPEFLPEDACQYQNIIKHLRENGEKFFDESFSGGKIVGKDASKYPLARLSERSKLGLCDEDGFIASDIHQGSLGDCWFLSAIACVAERPSLLKKVFINDGCQPEMGIFTVRLHRDGRFKQIMVDDYFPTVNHKRLAFVNSGSRQECWVQVLEKAYAKLNGSYEAIEGGFVSDGLVDLTGGSGSNVRFADSKNRDIVTSGGLWKKMLELHRGGHLLGAGSPAGSDTNVSSKGIVQGHAYSILSVIEADGNKLINLRNPWGQKEWTGKWSDGDRLSWTPRMKKLVKYVDKDDGSFWMSYNDFTRNYASLYICRLFPIEKFKTITLSSEWRGNRAAGKPGPNFKNNPIFRLKVTKKTTFYFNITQNETRGSRAKLVAMGMYIFKGPDIRDAVADSGGFYRGMCIASPSDSEVKAYSPLRSISTDIVLEPLDESYLVIGSTFHEKKEANFSIRISAEDPGFTFENL